jgi:hypothetical protein
LKPDLSLVGIGLYTPADASKLTGVPAQRIIRWLRGYTVHHKKYERLWTPQIDIGDDSVHLSFLDLIQLRVADGFIKAGLNPQKLRRAIGYAQEIVSGTYPLASAKFRTDGKTVILHVLRPGKDDT